MDCKTKYHYFILTLSPICLVLTSFFIILTIFYGEDERERVSENNILMNRLDN